VVNGQLWDLMLYFQSENYLISFSSETDGRWKSQVSQEQKRRERESKGKVSDGKSHQMSKKELIPRGYAFAVVLVTEKLGHKLIKIRSPLHMIKWDGEWAHHSKQWDHRLKQAIGEQHF